MSLCSAVLLVSAAGCVPRAAPSWALQRDSVAAQRCNAQGLALLEAGQAAEAGKRFGAALDADPFYGPAHSNLGIALLQQGQYFEAANELRYARQLMPRASQPRANLGILFELVGQYGEAEEQLREALRLAPEDVEIIGQLARVHVRQGKHTPETVAWLQTIASQDDHPAWRHWAGQQLITCKPINNARWEDPP